MAQSPEEDLMMNMIGAAPERETEIRSLWDKYRPSVVVQNAGKFRLGVTGKTITIDAKAPELFWLIGFSGWKAIETYMPIVEASAEHNIPIATLLRADDGLAEVERAYKERIL